MRVEGGGGGASTLMAKGETTGRRAHLGVRAVPLCAPLGSPPHLLCVVIKALRRPGGDCSTLALVCPPHKLGRCPMASSNMTGNNNA